MSFQSSLLGMSKGERVKKGLSSPPNKQKDRTLTSDRSNNLIFPRVFNITIVEDYKYSLTIWKIIFISGLFDLLWLFEYLTIWKIIFHLSRTAQKSFCGDNQTSLMETTFVSPLLLINLNNKLGTYLPEQNFELKIKYIIFPKLQSN